MDEQLKQMLNDLAQYKDIMDTFKSMVSMVSGSPDGIQLTIKLSPRTRQSNYVHCPTGIESIDNLDHSKWHPVIDVEVNGNYGYFVLDAIESFTQNTATETAQRNCERLIQSALMGFAFHLRSLEKNDSFNGVRWADAEDADEPIRYGIQDEPYDWDKREEIEGVDF